MNNNVTFRVARPVIEDRDSMQSILRGHCEQVFQDDFQEGVTIPVSEVSEPDFQGQVHELVGSPRFKMVGSLALPLVELIVPDDYRQAFHYAAGRFDERRPRKTVVTQVSKRITESDLEFDIPNQNHVPVTCANVELRFTERGHVLSLLPDEPEMFLREHKIVMDLMRFVGNMGRFNKEMESADETYIPRIPFVRFALNSTDEELQVIYDKAAREMPGSLVFGAVMPPKIF